MHGCIQHAGHRAVDVLLLARGVFRLSCQELHQFGQELHIGLGAFALQRIEAGRPAVLQREVVATTRADEDLGAAILVEEEHGRSRFELLRLCQQEVDERGLARSRLADDQGISQRFLTLGVFRRMRRMEVEVIGWPLLAAAS